MAAIEFQMKTCHIQCIMTEVPGMDLEDGGENAWLASPLLGEAQKLKKKFEYHHWKKHRQTPWTGSS